MTDADWLAQIEADVDDVATQLAYADWLHDQHEDQLAHAWGWMAWRGKRPLRLTAKGWAWYSGHEFGTNYPSDLARGVFEALPADAGFHRISGFWAYFRTLADAVDALAEALKKSESNRVCLGGWPLADEPNISDVT